jgi:hypothetical protein
LKAWAALHGKVKVAHTHTTQKCYWKWIGGKAYPLAGINEVALLLMETL